MDDFKGECSHNGGYGTCSAKIESLMDLTRFNRGLSIPIISTHNQIVHDTVAAALTVLVALACLRFWDEMAKRDVFDQKLNRKFVHISFGFVFMLCWPLFSTGPQAPYLAALAPGVNIFRMIGLGLGILKNEAMVKSISRYGDARELLKGPLYYASTLTLVTVVFWTTSPIGPVTISTLCAGDGFADIVGRRLGTIKLPYNKNKSLAGSFAMFLMGFTFSVGYMLYFASFGYYEVSTGMLLSSLLISIVATIVESLPISTQIDDNLTVPLVSVLVGLLFF
jgi:farnesol kinase